MKVYSVGQVNTYIKNMISGDYVLKDIVIRGEVSNCKYHNLGHIYFSVKDETGSIPAVMFKGNTSTGLGFTLREGQSVIIYGKIDVFLKDGKYQLQAREIKQDGIGKLHEEYEKLKQELNNKGIFDSDHKKPIPQYAKSVGIVTARTGAALQDIINIAKRRNPYIQLVLYPAKVQGEGAADTIVRGIKKLDGLNLDTIIVGRGGGSIEDLWAFNEEKVVMAIYEANTPIISGVGHEVDMTLADYVSDRRAPTPSAACELAVFDVMTSIKELNKLHNSIDNKIDNKVSLVKYRIEKYEGKMNSLSPNNILREQNQKLSGYYDRLSNSIKKTFNNYNHRLEVALTKLDGLSPTAKLINGFGYIEHNKKPLSSISMLKEKDIIDITLYEGQIKAVIEEVKKNND